MTVAVSNLTPFPGTLSGAPTRLICLIPFNARWYIRQVIEHGRSEDIARLDLVEVCNVLDELNLPPHLYSLWSRFLASRHVSR